MTKQPDVPLLTAGDSIPAVHLRDQADEIIPIYHASIAGDRVVLFLCDDDHDAETLVEIRRYSELAEAFKRQNVQVFFVTSRTVDDNRAFAERLGLKFRILSDRKGKLLPAFGLKTGGKRPNCQHLSAVLRPNLRIAKILDGKSQADAALAGCEALASKDAAPVIEAQAPVLIVDEIFPPKFCDFLIGIWQRGEKQKDQVTSEFGDRSDDVVKRRTDHIIFETEVSLRIHDYFTRRLVGEMAKAFRFGVTDAEHYRIGCYDAESGGHFRRHRDRGAPELKDRQFALSLNLNTGDYEGGHLRFPEFGRQLYHPPLGGGVVFSCSLLHEALPVTQGPPVRPVHLLQWAHGEVIERDGEGRIPIQAGE